MFYTTLPVEKDKGQRLASNNQKATANEHSPFQDKVGKRSFASKQPVGQKPTALM